MKFAYSSNAFKRYGFKEAAKLIKEIGYEGIEVLADKPHVYHLDYDYQKLEELRNYLNQLGLKVSNINAFTLEAIKDMHHPSFIDEKEDRKIRIEHTKKSLIVAKALGAKNISIIPGGRVEKYSIEESWNLFKEGLIEVLPYAELLGVKISIEPEPELLIEKSEQLLKILEEINHPYLGFNFDIGHFVCVNEDPVEIIKKYHHLIDHIHIEDIKDRVHKHLIIGDGDIDFERILKALKDVNYQGFITVELYPYLDNPVEAGRISLERLKNILNRA